MNPENNITKRLIKDVKSKNKTLGDLMVISKKVSDGGEQAFREGLITKEEFDRLNEETLEGFNKMSDNSNTSPNLVSQEKMEEFSTLLDKVNDFITEKIQSKQKEYEKKERKKKLTRQFLDVCKNFQVSKEETEKLKIELESFEDIEQAERWFQSLKDKLVSQFRQTHQDFMKSFQKRSSPAEKKEEEQVNTANIGEATSRRLEKVQNRASNVESSDAVVLYQKGLDAKIEEEKIEFFQKAIDLDKAQTKSVSNESEHSRKAKSPDDSVRPTEYLNIRNIALQRFEFLSTMISTNEADWEICREIIIYPC